MNFWLFKSEPLTWGWQQQLAAGEEGEAWTGVRNHQAKNYLRQMQSGDRGFFYHSGTERRIMGLIRLGSVAYPDPTDPQWDCVTICAVGTLPQPIYLNEIKKIDVLASMQLCTQPRLSVQRVEPLHWNYLCQMCGMESCVSGETGHLTLQR